MATRGRKVMKNNPVKCHDERKCFAKSCGECLILSSTYAPGECPFCKRDGGNVDADFVKWSRTLR